MPPSSILHFSGGALLKEIIYEEKIQLDKWVCLKTGLKIRLFSKMVKLNRLFLRMVKFGQFGLPKPNTESDIRSPKTDRIPNFFQTEAQPQFFYQHASQNDVKQGG